MTPTRAALLTALAMLAFAGNSLLCRAALQGAGMDATGFTAIRLVSGALVLGLIVRWRRRGAVGAGNWPSALALLVYALGFSLAYAQLSAATGALLLFVAVQVTMIGHGLWRGERLAPLQTSGVLLALGGLAALMLPGLAAPPTGSALLMGAAGVAWGVYSLRGKGAGDATQVTAGNFGRAALVAAGLGAVVLAQGHAVFSAAGLGYAVASGALASGLGYAVWYSVLPALRASTAATVQLSVPVIAAFGGVLWLGESLTPRLGLASLAILGGIALVILARRSAPPSA